MSDEEQKRRGGGKGRTKSDRRSDMSTRRKYTLPYSFLRICIDMGYRSMLVIDGLDWNFERKKPVAYFRGSYLIGKGTSVAI